MNSFPSWRIPVNPWLFSFAVGGAAFGLVSILDYPEIPSGGNIVISHILTLFGAMIAPLYSMGYAGLFALMFLESMALPIPSEVILPLAGYLVRTGSFTFPLALFVSTIASLLGSLAIFFLALKVSRPIIYRFAGKLGIGADKIQRSERWMGGRYGSALVLAARFIPGIRSSISIPAGSLKMNLASFTLMTLIGSFGWTLLLLYIGYTASPFLPTIWNLFLALAPYVATFVGLGYVSYFGYSKFRRR